MIVIGLLLLFLAIRKGFETLLLVPIGFGGILANIPGAGLAYSAVENAIYAADPADLKQLATVLGVAADAGLKVLIDAYESAPAQVQLAAQQLASNAGFNNGMLYSFYSVAIASGIAPLVIATE